MGSEQGARSSRVSGVGLEVLCGPLDTQEGSTCTEPGMGPPKRLTPIRDVLPPCPLLFGYFKGSHQSILSLSVIRSFQPVSLGLFKPRLMQLLSPAQCQVSSSGGISHPSGCWNRGWSCYTFTATSGDSWVKWQQKQKGRRGHSGPSGSCTAPCNVVLRVIISPWEPCGGDEVSAPFSAAQVQ